MRRSGDQEEGAVFSTNRENKGLGLGTEEGAVSSTNRENKGLGLGTEEGAVSSPNRENKLRIVGQRCCPSAHDPTFLLKSSKPQP